MVVKVLKNSENEFMDKIKKGLVLVDFSAHWCGPCQMLMPVIEEVAKNLEGRAVVYQVDVDECPSLPKKFGVQSLPGFVVLKNGEELERKIGFQSKRNILKIVKKHL